MKRKISKIDIIRGDCSGMEEERRKEDRRKKKRREEDRRKQNEKRNQLIDRRKENNRRVERRELARRAEERTYDDVVQGRNAVTELLNSDRDINKIYIQKGEKHGSINQIIAMAKEKKVVLVEVDRKKLEELCGKDNHQGVVAIVPPFDYVEVEDILELAKARKENPFLLILDSIEDPHNLGSIIRTAETAGVHGIIIPKRRAVGVNSTVSKVACGAVEHMKIARVNNLVETIRMLKYNGVWIYGTEMEGEKEYYEGDFKEPIAIIIGNEGSGMSRIVKEKCDVLLKIPMKGKINSLNAAVSAGIVVYEAVKQRN